MADLEKKRTKLRLMKKKEKNEETGKTFETKEKKEREQRKHMCPAKERPPTKNGRKMDDKTRKNGVGVRQRERRESETLK